MISIRLMEKEDIPRVHGILCSCYKWLADVERFPKSHLEFLIEQRGSIETIVRESKKEKYLVASMSEMIVGMISISKNEVTKLYVDPDWFRNSVGRKLFSEAIKIIRNEGYSSVVLGAIGDSPLPFYKSMGMNVVGKKRGKLPSGSGRENFILKLMF